MSTNYTPSQIAAALAPYVGQRLASFCFPNPKGPHTAPDAKVTYRLLEQVKRGWVDIKIHLRPLSSLADSEAREVARLCRIEFVSFQRYEPGTGFMRIKGFYERGPEAYEREDFTIWISEEGGFSIDNDDPESNYSYDVPAGVIADYLHSIGIDLPSHHFGGQTLHSAGLAVYETENPSPHEPHQTPTL